MIWSQMMVQESKKKVLLLRYCSCDNRCSINCRSKCCSSVLTLEGYQTATTLFFSLASTICRRLSVAIRCPSDCPACVMISQSWRRRGGQGLCAGHFLRCIEETPKLKQPWRCFKKKMHFILEKLHVVKWYKHTRLDSKPVICDTVWVFLSL